MKLQRNVVTDVVPNNTIGSIASFTDDGQAFVVSDYHSVPVLAMSTQYLADIQSLVGEKVLLSFIDNDAQQPVIVGLISQSVKNELLINNQATQQKKLSLSVESFDLTATDTIQLTVGRSQIILNRFGKVVIKGKDLISRASSNNKIKGGKISLN